jgi:hypothetical protein
MRSKARRKRIENQPKARTLPASSTVVLTDHKDSEDQGV